MRIRTGLAAIIGCAALCLALPAFGQTPVQVTYWSLVDSSVQADGFYAGIYNGTVNGASTQIVCDDANDEIGTGSTWSAKEYNIGAWFSGGGTVSAFLFGGANTGDGYANIGTSGYAEVANLVSMMFNGTTTLAGVTGTITKADISAAIWYITGAKTPSPYADRAVVAALVSALQTTYANSAAALAYLKTLTNLWVMTPDQLHGGQEMWRVPEGGAALLYLLLAGLTCFGAMRFSPGNRTA